MAKVNVLSVLRFILKVVLFATRKKNKEADKNKEKVYEMKD